MKVPWDYGTEAGKLNSGLLQGPTSLDVYLFFQPQSPVFPNPVSPVTTASSALEGVYVQNQQALSAWTMNEEYGIQWDILHLCQ